MKTFPVTHLDRSNGLGLEIRRFVHGKISGASLRLLEQAHRDNYYLFFVMVGGSCETMIDFMEVTFTAPSVCYILPSQVHRRINNLSADYWVLAVDNSFVPQPCRDVFERQRANQSSFSCTSVQQKRFLDLMMLLNDLYTDNKSTLFYYSALNGLLGTFLTMTADCFKNLSEHDKRQPRLEQLYGDFKQLLSSEVRHIKSASAYALKLNVSETYLNEATKKVTGFPVSYWIREEVICEAKRLLYHTEMDIKQIAYLLGYEDHSYFSRIFRKTTGTSASDFRRQYRK